MALVVDYYGNYDGTVAAHSALEKYMKENNMADQLAFPVIKECVTDPMTEPDPSKWLTRVYYLLQG